MTCTPVILDTVMNCHEIGKYSKKDLNDRWEEDFWIYSTTEMKTTVDGTCAWLSVTSKYSNL